MRKDKNTLNILKNTSTFLCSFLVLIVSFSLYGQEDFNANEIDSLSYLEYATLGKNISKKDTLASQIYIKAYFKKAKRENDTLRMAKSYHFKMFLNEYVITAPYTDSIIKLTKSNPSKDYPQIAYYFKGLDLYKKRNFIESLDNLLETKRLVNREDPDLDFVIGMLKSRLGNYNEALAIYQKILTHYINIGDKKSELIIMFALGDTYRFLKKYDSSNYYNKLGYRKAIEAKDKKSQSLFLLNEGATFSDMNKLQISQEKLKVGFPGIIEFEDKPNIAMSNFFLGRNYYNLKNEEKAIFHLKQMDSIFLEINDLHPELRSGYEILIGEYAKNNDLKNQLLYVNRLLRLDSILKRNYRHLSKKLNHDYDRPKLIAEKEKLISEINKKTKNYFRYVIIISTILIITLILLIYKNIKHKKDKIKFESLIKTLEKKEKENQTITEIKVDDVDITGEIDIGIKADIIEGVILKLEVFEKNHTFLNPYISINNLAKTFKTNSNYLSKIINYKKQKNFSNYVNDLRVSYAVNKLNNDIVFRKYTIIAIANEAGFNTAESFSRAFFKNTGIKVSYFLKEIEKNIS